MSDSTARALISRVTVDPYPVFFGGVRRPRFARILAAPEAAETNLGRAAIAERITPRAATAFKRDYYAVKSHCVPAYPAEPAISASSRLLRGEISSRGGATPRGGVRVLRAPTLKNNLHALRVDRPDSRRRSRAPCLGIARKPSLLRGFGPARRKSKALSAGAENTFHPAFIGVGREIGISCPEKIGIRVDRRGELHDDANCGTLHADFRRIGGVPSGARLRP